VGLRKLFAKILAYWATPYFLITILLFFLLVPVIWMFLTSFKPLQETLLWPPTYFPQHITEEAFTTVLSRSPVPTYLLNSVIISLLTTVVVTVAGLFTAYALVRYPFRGSRLALTGFLVVRLIPPISLLLPFYLILRYLGLINGGTGKNCVWR